MISFGGCIVLFQLIKETIEYPSFNNIKKLLSAPFTIHISPYDNFSDLVVAINKSIKFEEPSTLLKSIDLSENQYLQGIDALQLINKHLNNRYEIRIILDYSDKTTWKASILPTFEWHLLEDQLGKKSVEELYISLIPEENIILTEDENDCCSKLVFPEYRHCELNSSHSVIIDPLRTLDEEGQIYANSFVIFSDINDELNFVQFTRDENGLLFDWPQIRCSSRYSLVHVIDILVKHYGFKSRTTRIPKLFNDNSLLQKREFLIDSPSLMAQFGDDMLCVADSSNFVLDVLVNLFGIDDMNNIKTQLCINY